MSEVNTDNGLAVLMDIATLAEHLGVTERFIRGLVEHHRVPYHKIGKFVRFHPDDIADWLANTKVAERH